MTAEDSFGNPIDPVAGFARGTIITSATEEGLRLRNAQRIAAERVQAKGPESIAIFTGNQRNYPVHADDLTTLCEEWVGPGLFAPALRATGLAHLGGLGSDDVAVFNRTSAAIIATIVALVRDETVVSVVPAGGPSHASVGHGARLAGVEVLNVPVVEDWAEAIQTRRPKLVLVTTVTSSLERMDDADIRRVTALARELGAVTLLDEAYGARLRTALHGGTPSLQLGADLVVTNCDKAGLSGPRAGLLAGRPDLVARVSATGAGFGMEARAPIAAGALRSLEGYSPELLREEARAGQELAGALSKHYRDGVVRNSDLGPMIHEDDVLRDVLDRAGAPANEAAVVPCEASSALGVLLLRDHGILTVNTHGQPGARVSLRLKPTADAIHRVGGVTSVVEAVLSASKELAAVVTDRAAVAELVLGGNP
ncbi:aminotransferase class I/II-fold pyridoxal phosphate-dependent enzyme [Saccharopolyspora spinosa]|uniref:L-seryl-tRNA(Ser) seleniumtransferase n=1 Tax=Saccharopolyspora spinosa TaxID=60894 RepID=A0A2N3XV74_SACSN|nr:aminotransferase class I/II-fold pyridoxal phosphate-dependent enzyme [Saccharopolyspora spinosa]PKW14572.1 L-seryl-tRNA(Ser) seleniumtransferase [Saccharopolyspora spinosa]